MTSSQACQKLLVVDDHESVLSGTVSILEKEYPQMVIRTAMTAEDTEAKLIAEFPDLLLMDLSILAVRGSSRGQEVRKLSQRDIIKVHCRAAAQKAT